MEEIRMAFCPTMKPFAEVITNTIDSVKPVPTGSAAMALQMLKGEMVESVLIGRVAKSHELASEIKSKRLKEGVTLVYKHKTSIDVDQLKEIPVKTYLREKSITKVAGYFTKIAYVESKTQCLNGDLSIPVLIDWRDFEDSFELLIPVNRTGKVPDFRAPVIYYNKKIDKGLIEKIYRLINNQGV